jgi:hypothetical protein
MAHRDVATLGGIKCGEHPRDCCAPGGDELISHEALVFLIELFVLSIVMGERRRKQPVDERTLATSLRILDEFIELAHDVGEHFSFIGLETNNP